MAAKYQAGFNNAQAELEVQALPSSGTIPAWLSGTLVRNGPGMFEVGGQQLPHWFDGPALLHRFSFNQGQVSYANKFLRNSAYAYAKQLETAVVATVGGGSAPQVSASAGSQATGSPPVSSTNVNITRIGSHYIAMTEAPGVVEFELPSLQTVGAFDYQDRLFPGHTTAHPHYDFERGELINFIEQYGQTSAYQVYAIKPGQTSRTLLGLIPAAPELGYMHSFALTENYVILTESALYLNMMKLMQRMSSAPATPITDYKGFLSSYDWKPERGANFVVMSRKDGEVVGRYQAEAYFTFHQVNAFEEGDTLVIDLSAYPDASINYKFNLDTLTNPSGTAFPGGEYRRYRIPLNGTQADYEVIMPDGIELPRINYRRNNMKDYRYAYALNPNQQRPADFLNQLVKIDLHNRQSKTWYEDDCYPGEPVFVETPGATAEDAGVLLSVVLDGKTGTSFLLVLDAVSFEELGRASVPQAVPFGFHGQYFS